MDVNLSADEAKEYVQDLFFGVYQIEHLMDWLPWMCLALMITAMIGLERTTSSKLHTVFAWLIAASGVGYALTAALGLSLAFLQPDLAARIIADSVVNIAAGLFVAGMGTRIVANDKMEKLASKIESACDYSIDASIASNTLMRAAAPWPFAKLPRTVFFVLFIAVIMGVRVFTALVL